MSATQNIMHSSAVNLYNDENMMPINLTQEDSWFLSWALSTRTENVTKAAEAMKITIYSTEAVLGLVLNSILICAIVLGSHTSKQVHIQLINLAIADMLSGAVFWVTSMRTDELPGFTYFSGGQALCTFYIYFYSSISYISVLWGLAVSVERFIAIYFPLRLHHITHKKKTLSAVAVWILCFVLGIFGGLHAVYREFKLESAIVGQCYQSPNVPDTLYFNICTSLVPVNIMILLYILIACKLCCKKKIGETEQPGQLKQNVQIILMLSADAFFNLLSTICIIAPHVANVQWQTAGQPHPSEVYTFLCAVVLMNCFITPVFYFVFNQAIRQDVRNLFKRQRGSLRSKNYSLPQEYNIKSIEIAALDKNSSTTPMLANCSSV